MLRCRSLGEVHKHGCRAKRGTPSVLSNACVANLRVSVRASEYVQYYKTKTYQGQMIPSMCIVYVALKLTHEQQAPDKSSALVNKTVVAQTVIHHKAWIDLVLQ